MAELAKPPVIPGYDARKKQQDELRKLIATPSSRVQAPVETPMAKPIEFSFRPPQVTVPFGGPEQIPTIPSRVAVPFGGGAGYSPGFSPEEVAMKVAAEKTPPPEMQVSHTPSLRSNVVPGSSPLPVAPFIQAVDAAPGTLMMNPASPGTPNYQGTAADIAAADKAYYGNPTWVATGLQRGERRGGFREAAGGGASTVSAAPAAETFIPGRQVRLADGRLVHESQMPWFDQALMYAADALPLEERAKLLQGTSAQYGYAPRVNADANTVQADAQMLRVPAQNAQDYASAENQRAQGGNYRALAKAINEGRATGKGGAAKTPAPKIVELPTGGVDPITGAPTKQPWIQTADGFEAIPVDIFQDASEMLAQGVDPEILLPRVQAAVEKRKGKNPRIAIGGGGTAVTDKYFGSDEDE